ncbi:MAG: AAA domain-containing protein, partial [Clostridiaceae bacterium]|nr:AAA domain-containing protein [Clostridiaceae bacterium]
FIEGIKPKVIKGCTVFGLKYGIFKRLCTDAANNPGYKYYLIIDEINRGDIPGIFGELIMLLEADKRGKEVILPLSNSPFKIPENVYIVGTMNTADRSNMLLDPALRRRFGFIELLTDYRLLEGVVIEGLPLSGWLRDLNSRICEHIEKDGRNLQIGHSYFLEKGKPVNDSDRFKRIIKDDIIPLIGEYCYGDYALLARILGEGLVDVENQVIRYELFECSDVSDLINALLLPCPKLRSDETTVSDGINDTDDTDENLDEDLTGKF